MPAQMASAGQEKGQVDVSCGESSDTRGRTHWMRQSGERQVYANIFQCHSMGSWKTPTGSGLSGIAPTLPRHRRRQTAFLCAQAAKRGIKLHLAPICASVRARETLKNQGFRTNTAKAERDRRQRPDCPQACRAIA